MKELFLSGDTVMLKELFLQIKGVTAVTSGRIRAKAGVEARCVRVEYNPKKIDISGILREYFEVVDIYGKAKDPLEQPGVFYSSGEDVPQIEYYARYMQSRGAEPGAALGNLIVNDSITPGREIRRMTVNYGRKDTFEAQE